MPAEAASSILHIPLPHGLPCIFHMLTGLYCPGCGGTRAFFLLFTGHPLRSFLYHPIVLYGAGAAIFLLLCAALHKKKADTAPPIRVVPAILWGALTVTVINCLVKNAALLLFDIHMIP